MKSFFYILFALYFLGLSVIPCDDKDCCNENSQTQLSQSSDHQDNDNDICTPFCVCSSCAAHFVTTSIENDFAITYVDTQTYSDPITSKVIGAVLPIWQPPKV